jgi:hypothetical protein
VSREPAILEFGDNITVICGASDTGKSFSLESIDFALGSSKGLRDIPQRVGYERLRLEIRHDSEVATLERSVEGGGFRVASKAVADTEPLDGDTLTAQHRHGRTDNLSGWLLQKIGLQERRIKRNMAGATNSLSFRNLIDFVFISETDIIKETSPFQTGQYTTVTSEYATLKLLLTGVDDRALVDTRETKSEEVSSQAKMEILDQLIQELEHDLEEVSADETELEAQYTKLGEAIERVQSDLDAVRTQADATLAARRALLMERNSVEGRLDEITELLARFDLLADHYNTDLLRLEAIRDSGSLFASLRQGPCPLCGTPPEEQKHLESCDGDVASIVASSDAEIRKIDTLQQELANTRRDLAEESSHRREDRERLSSQISRLTSRIDQLLAPALSQTQGSFRELADKRTSISGELELYRRLDRLKAQRQDLLSTDEAAKEAEPTTVDLSKSVLEEFATCIEDILRKWHFPSIGRVYFDENTRDFVIQGKPRGSFGKGFRAITHAAITIGLMQYCIARSLPHPGFVILDSPLLAYWKPEGAADSLVGTDLKDRFFEYLCADEFQGQAIIVENEHPPSSWPRLKEIDFTRNPSEGRYGLFPVSRGS